MSFPALRAALLAVGLLLGCLAGAALTKPAQTPAQQQYNLQQLFKSIDRNGDEEISVTEAENYAAAALDMIDEGWSAQEAANTGRGALDGPDEGEGVTAAELRRHLRELLQDHRVVEWVIHGLNLPQYGPAFKQNSITALDFPFLVADGGAALEADLGVASKLHRQQILRGLKRLILGLGQLPAAPQQLACTSLNKSAVLLSWQAPPSAGHPAFHKYVLQRQRVAAAGGGKGGAPQPGNGGSGSGDSSGACAASPISGMCAVEERWEFAGEADDEEMSWVDLPPSKGSFRYRLAAWSAFGHSPYTLSVAPCTVRAVQKRWGLPAPAVPALPPASTTPAEVQALLAAAVAAAGGNLSGGRLALAGAAADGRGAGSGWSWSAASSAAVVALSILLKASQLRLGAVASALWRTAIASLSRRWRVGPPSPAASTTAGAAGAAGEGSEQEVGQLPQQQQQQQGRGGLRRSGTSHASLASLGSDPSAEEQQQQQQQAAAAAAYLLQAGASGGASQLLLSSGEASWGRLSSMQLEGSGLDPAAAADALAEAEASEVAAEQLQQAILRGAHCAHPGCHRRFDRLRDMRRRLESHYCALCQRMYCLHHTRISPHGPRGGCGLESKCACYACFAELSPSQQATYERINRLPKPTTGSNGGGPAAAEGLSAGPCGCSEQQLARGEGAGPAGLPPSMSPSRPASPEQQSGTASPTALYRSPSRAAAGAAARKRWHKAGKVLLALARFKAAGSVPASPHQ